MLTILAQADEALQGSLNLPAVHIHWLAIFGTTVVAMLIGSLWYGPLFGKKWMRLVKLTKEDIGKNWRKPIATVAIMAFVQAIIIRHFVVYVAYFYPQMSDLSIGILTGFWLFAGVAAPLVLSGNMFARRKASLSFIEAGNQFVTLLTVGAILAVWT